MLFRSLLQEYGSLEGIYENIENIKGKTREKLETDKENAFMSKEIATIYREVPLDVEFEGIKYLGTNEKELASIYEELEFYSLLKNFDRKSTEEKNIEFKEIKDINEVELGNEVSIYLELDEENYHKGNILGIGVSDKEHNYYLENSMLKDLIPLLKDKVVYTYNAKALEIIMRRNDLELAPVNYDLMIAAYLVNAFTKDDIAYLMNPQMYSVEFYENNAKNNFADKEKLKKEIVLKSRFIYDTRDIYINELKKEAMYEDRKSVV